MRLDFSEQRILAAVAHPDDCELLCAGTLARARDEGATLGIFVFCQGEKGQPIEPVENLAAVRQEEMRRAAELLGAELIFAHVPDSELTDDMATRTVLVESLRRFRPTLVLGHFERDYHADHRAASRLVDVGSWLSASHGLSTDPPPLEYPPEVWWMDTVAGHQFEPDFYIDVTPYDDLKKQMLSCHKSQLQRGKDSNFSPLQTLMEKQQAFRGAQSGVAAAEAFRLHRTFGRTRAW